MGRQVFVISSENPFKYESEWSNEMQHITKYQMPLKYPTSLIVFPNDIFGRISYRVSLFFVKLFSKGNYYDRTIFWRDQLINTASRIIKDHKVNNVIITGAPFSLFSYGVDIKKCFSTINLVADIRDPWTSNTSAYGFTSISKKRFEFEQEKERNVFRSYDKVITVSDEITNYFKGLYNDSSDKFITIPNGFDVNDMEVDEQIPFILDREKINLVFAGSFYKGASYLLESLCIVLQKNDMFQNINFYFLGPQDEFISKIISKYELRKQFFVHGSLPLNKVNAIIDQADYGMLFLTDDINYSLSTKFCEYIKFRKKMLVFSKPGATSNYVKNQQLGFHVEFGKEEDVLKTISKSDAKEFPLSFNVSQFSISELVHKVDSVLL